ncbi:MAG: CsgG/HfaB family protein [Opitutales bacterium]|nr:CsgG/HfaB family protein [Opitutales bacterium]
MKPHSYPRLAGTIMRFVNVAAVSAAGFGLLPNLIAAEDTDSGLPRIVVVDFGLTDRKYDYDLSGKISEMIQEGLYNTGLFEVLERDKLDTVMTEQGWTNSGMVKPEDAVSMGKMMGAGYILTGTIISMDSEEKNFRGYGVTTRSTIVTLRARAQILETETGKVFFSRSSKASTVINEAGGLTNSNTGVFVDLAEQITDDIISGIKEHKGFRSQTNDVEIVAVDIKSVPEMADVEVDGVFYGNANGPISIPAGMRNVRISLPGYVAWEKKVMVSENTRIVAQLKEVNQYE